MVEWKYTNESLPAIVAGLDLENSKGQYVWAICGSGDQAYAIAEFVPRVVAVDNNKNQLDFAKKRGERIKNGDVNGFLEASRGTSCFGQDLDRRIEYFDGDRLRKIGPRTSRVSFVHGDVYESIADQQFSFSRVYLSNTPALLNGDFDRKMDSLISNLPVGALIYGVVKRKGFHIFHGELKIEKRLTTLARSLEPAKSKWLPAWKPSVYRKVE